MNVIKENKKALLFLIKFVGLYLLLNSLYAFFVQSFYPVADPYTKFVTQNTSHVLNLFGHQSKAVGSFSDPNVKLTNYNIGVVDVYEGCNGLSVIIVFFSFILSYSDKISRTLKFAVVGFATLYLSNILRVMALFAVAIHFPQYLYLFHKYLLTGILYGIVFLMWYFWTKPAALNEPK